MIPSGSVRGLLIACLFGLVASLGVSREVAAQDRLRGIDVSHHQGDVDWKKVKGSGVAFAFAKATEGETYTDPKFARNWAGMREAGLVRGAYHFGRPGHDPVAQARHFVKAVGARSGDLQLALDLEKDDGKSPAEVWDWTKRFLAEIKLLTGRPGIIYTSRVLLGRQGRRPEGEPRLPALDRRLPLGRAPGAQGVVGLELLAALGQGDGAGGRGRPATWTISTATRPGSSSLTLP